MQQLLLNLIVFREQMQLSYVKTDLGGDAILQIHQVAPRLLVIYDGCAVGIALGEAVERQLEIDAQLLGGARPGKGKWVVVAGRRRACQVVLRVKDAQERVGADPQLPPGVLDLGAGIHHVPAVGQG